jgi:hypothetical protein
MNNPRRKAIQKIIDNLYDLKSQLDDVFDDEQEYRDNIPENMQGGERYERADEARDNLSDAVDGLDEVISSLEAAIE